MKQVIKLGSSISLFFCSFFLVFIRLCWNDAEKFCWRNVLIAAFWLIKTHNDLVEGNGNIYVSYSSQIKSCLQALLILCLKCRWKNDIQIYKSGFTKIHSRLQQTNSPYHASTFGNYTFPSPPTLATVVYLTGGAATRREPDCES